MAIGLLSVLSTITVSAATAELLTNPGFEQDDANWKAYGACSMDISSDVKHTGAKSMSITSRTTRYSSPRETLNDVFTVNGPGTYTFSVWAKLGDGAVPGPCNVVIIVKDANGNKWYTATEITLSNTWQKIEAVDKDIEFTGDVTDSGIYIQTGNTDAYLADIYVDDFSLVKTSAVNGHPIPTKGQPIAGDATKRGDKAAIGLIRWDAWYGTPRTGTTGVVEQVEKTLSPAKYHWRVPFFGNINTDGTVSFPDYTQATMDKEIQYAADAGIDYWAYVWYANDTMGKVRKFYETSQYKNKIKICSIFDGNQGGAATVAEVKSLIQQGLWQTVQGGRPLMYYFGGGKDNSKDIATYRAMCDEIGVPAPYVAIMGGTKDDVALNIADAVSDYTIGGSNGIDYKSYSEVNEPRSWNRAAQDGQMIACASAGWNNQPRRDNPVSWINPPPAETSWVQDGTSEQIANSLMLALQWTANNPKYTMANAVIMYAWNEHDEGGWICPTLAVDSAGNQLKNADGTNQINTSRLDAIKAVITEYKTVGVPTATPKPTPGATRSPAPDPNATATPQVTSTKGNAVPIIIGFVVVVLLGGGVAGFMVMKKKKQTPGAPTPEGPTE